MIELVKSSTASFYLKADKQGIEKMLMYIKTLSDKSEKCLQVLYLGNERNFVIKHNSNTDEMLISKDIIKVYLDEEELKYFEQRLNNSLVSNCFYPAEICEQRYKNKNITLYCDIIS